MEDDESRVILELLQSKDREIGVLIQEKARLREQIDAMAWDLEVAKGRVEPESPSAAFNEQLLAFESQLVALRCETDRALRHHGGPQQLSHKTTRAMALEQALQREPSSSPGLLQKRLHSMFEANCELIQRIAEPRLSEKTPVSTAEALPATRATTQTAVEPALSPVVLAELQCNESDKSATDTQHCECAVEMLRQAQMLHDLRATCEAQALALASATNDVARLELDRQYAGLAHDRASMERADLEAQVVACRLQCEAAERAKLEIIDQATRLVQAAEVETEATLESLDEFGHVQLRPWVDVSAGDRAAKYELQAALMAATERSRQLEADVALEMAKSRASREEVDAWAAQATEWGALHDAFEALQTTLQHRVKFLSQGLAQVLAAKDKTVDWTSFLAQLFAQSVVSPPAYRPKLVLSPDKSHVCTWQLQATMWLQKLRAKELVVATLEEEIESLKHDAAHADDAKALCVALKKKLAAAKTEGDQWKASTDELRTKATALAREKAELTHLVARLREDNHRLKESVARKADLVAHYKLGVETARKEAVALATAPRPPAAPTATATAKKSLLKHHQDQVATLSSEIAVAQETLRKAEAQNRVLMSRCARLQMALREKEAPVKEEPDEEPPKNEGSDETKELRRRLAQKHAVVEALKARERVQKEASETLQATLDQLTRRLKQQVVDATALHQLSASQAQLDGLRACVYDAFYCALLQTKEGAPPLSVEQLRSVGVDDFDAAEIALLKETSIKEKALEALEDALERAPHDCRGALLDALHQARH
ncbi:hypothetical protein ACHHYP_01065 [Achlya hypogyna]|uniref:Uncharacterized protein n=1 Tax=Achlya hypogyna TaxID=1202772 RepID=A0A1V9ZTQ9_ACHHY|nr:hypothetical protein ACHHYP_01065 [Achlya hypogyna]